MAPFTVVTADQRTDAWRLSRVGRLCGSRAADMLATIKSGEAAARRDLRVQLVVERLTGQPQDDSFTSKEMQRGIDKEAHARAAYEAQTGLFVRQTGFLAHRDLMAGCSPDGVIGHYVGLLEVKCPKSATHLATVRAGTVPSSYRPQLQHALWITGAEWIDFVSYDDRFPAALRLFVTRFTMSEADRKSYELLVRMFLAEVDREFADVQSMALAGAAA